MNVPQCEILRNKRGNVKIRNIV